MKKLPLAVPYPPPILNPNARPHWAHKAKVKARYRLLCSMTVEQQLRWLGPDPDRDALLLSPRLLIEVCAFRVTGQPIDKDNLIAALKSGLDGVAQALELNDARFDFGAVEFGRVARRDEQRVLLLFSPSPGRARVCWW